MTFTAYGDGRFDLDGRWTRCAIGPGGVIAAAAKREGDGRTPLGAWPIRRVLYRPDRRRPPATALPVAALSPDDGWCDAPGDANYNRPVKLPCAASAERLWRDDLVYDLIAVLGHNDDPVVAGAGSAIFLHLARPDFSATQGCVALSADDLEALLARAAPGDVLTIREI
jgi:L,D-peptidoglycan transpeptidase YkuD (ErfK/YbiS/YcfS/YnhG family)